MAIIMTRAAAEAGDWDRADDIEDTLMSLDLGYTRKAIDG